jgi:hypothetical protein
MKSFTCDNCGQKKTHYKKSKHSNKEIPVRWITMKLDMYENDLSKDDRKLIYSGQGNELHFCNKECMVNHFFYINQNPNTQQTASR